MSIYCTYQFVLRFCLHIVSIDYLLGALHGQGWSEGEVKVSDIWDTFPFSNTLCTGVMSGISMFRVFDFATTSATFEGRDTLAGGDLQQVSGARVTYNTKLTGGPRLINLEVWNETRGEYVQVERLKMYNFTTDSYNCVANDPFNQFTGSMLMIPGEAPGQGMYQ